MQVTSLVIQCLRIHLAMQETQVLIPESGRSPREGNGNPLQYSCLENPMDRGAWLATVHGVAKSRTQLRDFHFWDLRSSICLVFVGLPQRLSHVRPFETPRTAAHLAPLSVGFSSQEYWSGLPCPFPGHPPDPGIKSVSPVFPELQDSLPLSLWGSPTKTRQIEDLRSQK